MRSAVNIQWDELKQIYSSKEFDVRMPSSASNLPAVPAARVPKPAGVDILRSRKEGKLLFATGAYNWPAVCGIGPIGTLNARLRLSGHDRSMSLEPLDEL